MELKLGQVYYIEFQDKKKEPIIIRLVTQSFDSLSGAACNVKGEWFDSEHVIDCETIKNTFIAPIGMLTVLSFAEQDYKEAKSKNDKKMRDWLGPRR